MKKKIGYCALTADPLHYGHIIYLEKCKENCGQLYVGVMSDEAVISYKGNKPLQSVYERERVIRALKMVSGTFIQNTFEFPYFITEMAERKDYHIFDSTEHSRSGATMCFDRTDNISSTIIRKHNENTYTSELKI